MTYIYRRVLISGTSEGVEGVSAGLSEISTFMQDCGWNLVDDRSLEPGTSANATHMKYVFSSNGENGNYPTYYATLSSGSAPTANSNLLYASVSTAYDVVAHTTPASGVSTLNTTLNTDNNGDNRLQIISQSDNTEIYMAGDSEMVHLITRKEIANNDAATMDNIFFGRFNSFFNLEDNPYPLIVQGVAGNGITTATASFPRAVWSNPPLTDSARGHVTTISITPSFDASQPYQMGVDSIFIALPILVHYITVGTTDTVKAVAGSIRNGWVGADSTRLPNLSILTASGSEGAQEFITFTQENTATIPSIIVRKS